MKKMMYDSLRLALVLVAMTAGLASCGKDEVTGRVNLATDLLVIDEPGDTRTVNFTTSHVRSLSVSTTPEGWKAEADLAAGVLTVTAPARIDETVKRSGSVVLSGTTTDGGAVSASLAVGVYESVDLSAAPSNCYLLSKKDTYYRIDALHRGETSETLPTASVKLIWQTAGKPLQYVALHDGKISFLVGADDDGELKEGNALLGAYDAAGELIWSWHVWVTAYDPEKDATVYGDYTVMNRNLGALNNANASAAEILSSYGMYYQWGRKPALPHGDEVFGRDGNRRVCAAQSALLHPRNRGVGVRLALCGARREPMERPQDGERSLPARLEGPVGRPVCEPLDRRQIGRCGCAGRALRLGADRRDGFVAVDGAWTSDLSDGPGPEYL